MDIMMSIFLTRTPAKENTQHQHAAIHAEQCFKYVVTTYQ